MKPVLLAALLAAALPAAARADDLCAQLGHAVELAKTDFKSIEGDALPSNNGQYWRSTIQLSAGDNCAVEAHRILTCSWEPSTEDDLKKMVASVGACFPDAQKQTVAVGDGLPPETDFKFDAATIQLGLTADVLSLNVGP